MQERAYRLQFVALKGVVLLLLAIGAISPVFRRDTAALCVSVFCVALLSVLAGTALFRRMTS
jgi:hypothetical protein